jgi:beta-galactosidase
MIDEFLPVPTFEGLKCQLWVVATEFMDAATQERLAAYVAGGGHLIVTPVVPTLDEYLRPCTILRDVLGLKFQGGPACGKVTAFGIDEIYSPVGYRQIFDGSAGTAVATTGEGAMCGVSADAGKGRVTALGFAFGYTTDDHLLLLEKIVGLDGITRDAVVSDPDIQFVLRRGKKRSYLFLMNYHNRKATFTVDGRRHSLEPFSCTIVTRKS